LLFGCCVFGVVKPYPATVGVVPECSPFGSRCQVDGGELLGGSEGIRPGRPWVLRNTWAVSPGGFREVLFALGTGESAVRIGLKTVVAGFRRIWWVVFGGHG